MSNEHCENMKMYIVKDLLFNGKHCRLDIKEQCSN